MKLTSESKFFLGIFVATAAVIGIAIWIFSRPSQAIVIPKETLIAADTHTKGNKDALVYLVEFSDFQCPACAAFSPAVETLTETYKDQLFFAYRHYPLPQHEFARPAAYAAEAAALQGKFWEAVPLLFKNQNNFSESYWGVVAETLGLKKDVFQKDMNSAEIKEKVERDLAQAQQLNLRSTPTFFLNGVLLANLYGPQDLVKAVEKTLNNK